MINITEIVCERCKKKFTRKTAEVNRSKKLNRRNFCSRRCQCQDNIEHIPNSLRYHPENLLAGKEKDKYSPFRWYIKQIRQRQKDSNHKGSDIDLNYLLLLWEQQNGICPITGWTLIPRTHEYNSKLCIKHASLDRIENHKGYIQGNVRFISVMANYALNTFSDEELIEFCKAVSTFNKQRRTFVL